MQDLTSPAGRFSRESIAYTFGPFRLEPSEGRLLRDGEPVPLAPKAFELLGVLVAHAGHLVTKEQLLARVWPGTFVEEANLSYTVSLLRKALGDDSEPHLYVETIPRRGYRFIASVASRERAIATTEALSPGPAPVPAPRASNWRRRAILAASTAMAALGVVGLIRLFSTGPPRAGQPAVPIRLTFDPGLQTEPTFSPDGRSIAYTSNKSGNFDIWMQLVAGGNPVQVTNHPGHDWQPHWSPDGSRIAFRSERDGGGLWVVPATGGREERLTTLGYKPRWSPDGSRILFVESALFGAPRGRVYTFRLDGSAPEPIDTRALTPTLRTRGTVGWHPDGQRIMFLFSPSPLGVPIDAATVDVVRGVTRQLEMRSQVRQAFADHRLVPLETEPLAWSPNAAVVYFVAFSRGLYNIWSIDVDPRTAAIVGGPHRITTMPQTNEGLSLAGGGAAIAFGAADRNPRIVSYPLDAAGGRITGPGRAISPPGIFAFAPDFTPDSRRLLYRAQRRGDGTGRTELRIVADGQERIGTVDESYARREWRFSPRWSPDGRRIAYTFHRREPTDPSFGPSVLSAIMVFDVEAGSESPLTSLTSTLKSGGGTAYGWSADGRFVVSSGRRFTPGREAGHAAIALVPVAAAPRAETQATIVTTSAEYTLHNTRMSPNGRWVCFNATRSGASRIGVVATSGGTWTWLTDGRDWADKPTWSVDGRLLYFLSRQGGLPNVWAVGFDADRGMAVGGALQVTRFDGSGEHIPDDVGQVELAVGANRMAIPIIDPTGGIWLLGPLRQ